MTETVLVVNDNDSHYQEVEDALRAQLDYSIVTARSSEAVLSLLMSEQQPQPDIVLIDMMRPEQDGLSLLHSIKICRPYLPVLMLVAYGDDKTVEQAMLMGAADFLVKPLWLNQLRMRLSNVITLQRMASYISYLERKHSGQITFSDIVGKSQAIKDVIAVARQAINSSAPLWISGEQGTGKGLLASAIHGASGRAGKPFIAVECSALDENEAEKLLFGYQGQSPGSIAFIGKIQEATDGTVLLRDFEALPEAIQEKLAQVMQTGSLFLEGGRVRIPCNARFILTHTDRGESIMMPEGLYPSKYRRLCSQAITMPSLSDRKEDIPELANYFVRMYAASEHKKIRKLTNECLKYLMDCPWPGNARELMHLMWKAVLFSTKEFIELGDIRLIQQLQPNYYVEPYKHMTRRTNPLLLDTQGRMKNLESIEKDVIQFALTYTGGCMTHAAKQLGIGRSTLYRRMHALNLNHHISRENQTIRPTMRISSGKHS